MGKKNNFKIKKRDKNSLLLNDILNNKKSWSMQ